MKSKWENIWGDMQKTKKMQDIEREILSWAEETMNVGPNYKIPTKPEKLRLINGWRDQDYVELKTAFLFAIPFLGAKKETTECKYVTCSKPNCKCLSIKSKLNSPLSSTYDQSNDPLKQNIVTTKFANSYEKEITLELNTNYCDVDNVDISFSNGFMIISIPKVTQKETQQPSNIDIKFN